MERKDEFCPDHDFTYKAVKWKQSQDTTENNITVETVTYISSNKNDYRKMFKGKHLHFSQPF